MTISLSTRQIIVAIGLTAAVFSALLFSATSIFAQNAAPLNSTSLQKPAPPSKRVVVVCPAEWQTGLEKWLAARRQQGYEIRVFAPAADATATRDLIVAEHAKVPLAAVLLVGDVPTTQIKTEPKLDPPPQPIKPAIAKALTPQPGTPTFLIPAAVIPRWGGSKEIASDYPYADLNGDGAPELAVGRWPVDSAAEVQALAERTLAYENSTDFSDWRARINLVAGVGGFGTVTDAAIENGARQVVLSGLPQGYQTTLTFGSWTSPHCPDPRKFSAAARERFNEGCLFWVYIGHGQSRGLDWLRTPDRKFHSILEYDDCRQLAARRGSPIAMFLACSTGAFDQPRDCLAEELLRAPVGPVAVIASTRVAMPYGLSVFACEALRASLQQQTSTLGEVVRLAKARSMDHEAPAEPLPARKMLDAAAVLLTPGGHDATAERAEHLHLLTLFGDPLLRLPYQPRLELVAPSQAKPGETITLRAAAPCAGTCRWELCLPPGKLAIPAPQRKTYDPAATALQEFQAIYERTLVMQIGNHVQQAAGGQIETQLTLPPDAKGEYLVRLWFEGADRCALGCAKIHIK